MLYTLSNALITVAISILIIRFLTPVSTSIGLVDSPSERKLHEGNIPLIGGIAVFISFLFGLLTLPVSLSEYRALIACQGILVIVGLLDDFRELTPRTRLWAQLLVALLVVFWGGHKLDTLGSILGQGPIFLGMLAIPITLFAIMAVINAYNMLDGMDGLAGGITFTQIVILMIACLKEKVILPTLILSLFAGSLIGFLCFNFPCKRRKSKIFLGDAGSMLLGVTLVWFAIELSQSQNHQPPLLQPSTLLWVLALPLYEIMSAVIRRLAKRQSPLKADRGHMHHRLLDYGLTPTQTVYCLCLGSLVLGLIGISFNYFEVKEIYSFISFIIVFLGYGGWLQWGRKKEV